MKVRTRSLMVFTVVALVVVAVAAPAFAGYGGMAGKSTVGQLHLYSKTPTATGPWTIVPGPSGKMMYKLCPMKTLPKFVFNGQGLIPGDSYTLLNYTGYTHVQNILGTGVADEHGDIHIAGAYMTPLVHEDPPDAMIPGAKIWLVHNSLLSGGSFIAWDPSKILFEGVGIALP